MPMLASRECAGELGSKSTGAKKPKDDCELRMRPSSPVLIMHSWCTNIDHGSRRSRRVQKGTGGTLQYYATLHLNTKMYGRTLSY